MKEEIILGIDPGTNIMGYGLLKISDKHPSLILLGCLELQKIKTHYEKLHKIFERTLMLIDEYHPCEFAIEAQFFGNNVQSMLKLGRAQGVAISAALFRGLPVFEYAPRKVKQSITGMGGASKIQVAGFLSKILKIENLPRDLDATDGVAVALCHYYQKNTINCEKGSNSWDDFIKKNPGRVLNS